MKRAVETREIRPSVESVSEGTALWRKARAFLRKHPASEAFKREVRRSAANVPDNDLRGIVGADFPREQVAAQIRKALFSAREKAGLSQKEIARRMGVLQPAVSRIETAANVSVKSFAAYLAACGCTATITVRRSADRFASTQT